MVVVGATVIGEPAIAPGIQLYVVAPPPVSVTLVPAHTAVVGDDVAVTVGVGRTVMVCVVVPVPFAFVAVCVTVYVPAVFHTTLATFCVVAFAGVPLGNVHVHVVGLFVELSVKLTGVPRHTEVALAVNAALGNAEVVVVMFTLST